MKALLKKIDDNGNIFIQPCDNVGGVLDLPEINITKIGPRWYHELGIEIVGYVHQDSDEEEVEYAQLEWIIPEYGKTEEKGKVANPTWLDADTLLTWYPNKVRWLANREYYIKKIQYVLNNLGQAGCTLGYMQSLLEDLTLVLNK